MDREFCIAYITDDCAICPELSEDESCTTGSHCFDVKQKIIADLRKLDKIEQIVNCELIAGKHDYKACYTAFYEIVDVIQDREVLEQDN